MALIAGTLYDPASAANIVTTGLLAMTAMDTTNLRLVFTVPADGKVLVRMAGNIHGSGTVPQILLGVLEGATVKGRIAPSGGLHGPSAATMFYGHEASFVVPGLTAGASLTWDAAMGVEINVASSGMKYGGPDNTTANDAFGGFCFEIWEATNCLSSILYDPGTAVNKVTDTRIAMTALDTTNLRATFTAPGSGKVLVRLSAVTHGATGSPPSILLGVMDGSTIKGRMAPIGAQKGTSLATTQNTHESNFLVTGLTPGASTTWDAAYGVETEVAATGLKYGGPNNATTNDAFGAFVYEIWEA